MNVQEEGEEEDAEEMKQEVEVEEEPPAPSSISKSVKKASRKRARTELELLGDVVLPSPEAEHESDHLILLKFLRSRVKSKMEGLKQELKELETMIRDYKKRQKGEE